jgi:hypothetical protein
MAPSRPRVAVARGTPWPRPGRTKTGYRGCRLATAVRLPSPWRRCSSQGIAYDLARLLEIGESLTMHCKCEATVISIQ